MRRIFSLCISTLPALAAHPQVVFHSLPEVLTAALRDNPTQRIYKLKSSQLTYEYYAQQSYLYPQIGAAISGQDNLKLSVTPVPGVLINQPGKTLYLTFSKHYVYNAGLNATQNLFNWQYTLQSNIAHENLTINTLQQEAYEQNLKATTAQYYFSGLIAASSIQISNRDLQLADSILSTVNGRYTQGLVDLGAVRSAEINVNNVRQNILLSTQLLAQSIQNLKLLTGCSAQQALSLDEQLAADSIETETTTTTPTLGLDKNLNIYEANTHLADLQTKFVKAAFYPTLSLNGFAGSQQFRDNFGLAFGEAAWNDYRYLQLSLNLPLFTGFYTRNKYRSAQTLARINAEQYRDAVEEGKISDSLLISTYDNYRLLVAASGRNLLLYRSNVELSRKKFEEGLISVDTFQKTFEDYLRAENTHLNNLSSLYAALSSIISRN
ncbi:MAG TPA: TolC family protein [Puia sp.]|jgi:outer membrane protein TolC|nr:TolC family protein [Puia sp.]